MMTRARSWLVVAIATGSWAGSTGLAYADSQAEIAARENDEGRDLMYASKYDEATAKFRDAVARVPEAKYFFNLCTSLFQEGRFGEALTACNSAAKNNTDDALKAKIEKMSGKIQDEAKAQGLDLQPVGGGGGDPNLPPQPDPNVAPPDPNAPPPNPNTPPDPNRPPQPMQQPAMVQYRPVQGRPPPGQGVFVAVRPDHNYTWTLGVDLFGGGGQIGAANAYGNAAGGIRLKGDFLFNRRNRIGAQFYIQYTNVGAGSDQMSTNVNSLDIVDVGAALYKHVCLASGHICLTPLAGASLALMSPNSQTDADGNELFNYAALGVRLELAASYAFGPRLQNVISVMGGVNAYSSVLSTPDGETAASVGLDSGGAFGYLGFGYTYRFNTPLGHSALVTLE